MSGAFSHAGIDAPVPPGFDKVVEGHAAVLFPPSKTTGRPSSSPGECGEGTFDLGGGGDEDQSIFYNPAQVVNRDLSICAIEAFSRLRPTEPRRKGGTTAGITILEALSATGLRALRYWKEISGVQYIIANDLDADAVDCIRRNCCYNDIPVATPTLYANMSESDKQCGGGIIPNHDDAIVLMQRLAMNMNLLPTRQGARVALLPPVAATTTSAADAQPSPSPNSGVDDACSAPASPMPLLQQELMDVVDLDPYGTASPFLDAAFACIKEGGLMLVTSTDSPILCGNYPDTCHAKYNSIMMKPDACHEVAVRILLAAAERVANKHKKYIVPLISLHIDFYVRVFFRVYTQAAEAKLATAKLAHVAHCTRCPGFWLSPIGRAKMARKEVAKKRQRGGDGAGASGPAGDAAAPPEQPTGVQPPAPPVSFPQPPPRQVPFKVSCPTIETWLPSGNDNHCPICGGHIAIGGPIYAAPTQNPEFLQQLLAVVNERAESGKITATERVRGLIHAAMDELPDAPLFYSLPEVASFARVRCPPTPIFVGALGRLGYQFSQVHCHKSGIKTTCPPSVLLQAMLAYKRHCDASTTATTDKDDAGAPSQQSEHVEEQPEPHGTGKQAVVAGGDRAVILLPPLDGLDFSYDRKFDFRSSVTGVSKFIPNAPGWGPKRRHQGVADA